MNGISIEFNIVLINTEDTFKVFDFFSAISYRIFGNFSNNIFFAFLLSLLYRIIFNTQTLYLVLVPIKTFQIAKKMTDANKKGRNFSPFS